MKIQYINNTCDIRALQKFGEILILIKGGEPVSHLDYSDDVVSLDVLPELLKPFGFDFEFEKITPNKELITKIKQYLNDIYGKM